MSFWFGCPLAAQARRAVKKGGSVSVPHNAQTVKRPEWQPGRCRGFCGLRARSMEGAAE
ncbi:hypothetical protein [Acetobacter pomorum]|uniref:hypothetical protein n=1 Tax=Acetobacter pomorum TaxID=65959 RepID=UPI001ABFD831|nr:hypothetical protein [Acetobacter pomorum]